MTFIKDLNLLIKARYTFIYISTFEEERLEYFIRKALNLIDIKLIYTWDFVDGFNLSFNKNKFASKNPLQVLEFIENYSVDKSVIFILKDFNKFLSDTVISRKIKNLSRQLKNQKKILIIVASENIFPKELLNYLKLLEFSLSSEKEIKNELTRLGNLIGKNFDSFFLEDLVHACKGLSLENIRRILFKSVAKYSLIDKQTINLILKEKCQLIKETQILDFETTTTKFSDIGGLENLKKWLFSRKNSFSEKARLYGLKPPRGLLLTGIPGTGKSLTAKTIANEWNLPLLKLDIGRLFGGILGESENKIRQMIQLSESLSPCILWIDEIDKTFTEKIQISDNGTTNRVLSTFITWLSEKNSNVFIVATANNFSNMPSELIRKGRFDEIFFLGLPNFKERKNLFHIFLKRLRPNNFHIFDLENFAFKSEGFSGAEIEQSIIEAMHIAFMEKREFTNLDILFGLTQIIPFSVLDFKRIKQIQSFVLSGQIRLASEL
jgi:ATP-dependent 26S proteasome regulatory subunit